MKPKKQGTQRETWFVNEARKRGFPAQRLVEGGSADEGDVELWIGLDSSRRVVVEVRDRQAMSLHTALEKAVGKTGKPNRTFLWWSRPIKRKVIRRRQHLVAMPPEAFWELLGRPNPAASRARMEELDGQLSFDDGRFDVV